MALPPHSLGSGQRNNFQAHNKTPNCFCCSFPRPGKSQTKISIPGSPCAPVTFLPAEPGVPQDPILVVIKVDFSMGREEGVGQLPRGAIEAVVGQRLQAVRVVDGVETWGKSSRISLPRNPLAHWKVSDGIPGVFQPPGSQKER